MEAGVFGFIDDAHAATAEFFDDTVVGEGWSHQRKSVGHGGDILAGARKRPKREAG
jgi:hypothetical protein